MEPRWEGSPAGRIKPSSFGVRRRKPAIGVILITCSCDAYEATEGFDRRQFSVASVIC